VIGVRPGHDPLGGLIHRKTPSRKRADVARRKSATRSILMLDIVMLALGFGFFVVGIGYAYACERL
jgi:hypothetical protein